MVKISIFRDINFGKFAHDEIKVTEEFTQSNDFEGAYVEINGAEVSSSISTGDAVRDALDDETAEWILSHMKWR